MANASNASGPTAVQPELEANTIETRLLRMQKNIADVRRSLQHLYLRQRENNFRAAQRDAELMELIKMQAPGDEPLQRLASRNVVNAGVAAELSIQRTVLPSVEEEVQDREDELPAGSPAHTSSAGESGDEVETYEPPDVVAVHFEVPATGKKAVGYTVGTYTARHGQPGSRSPPPNTDATQYAPLETHKPCNEPETDDERKAGDASVPDDEAMMQMRKRQRTANIIRQAYHVAQ
ncbi:hypothetical protein PMIN06_012701 [Paraphaeosphaeria minitans]